jgi:hypothetical protein
LRRSADVATIKLSGPKGSASQPTAPKLKGQENNQQLNLQNDDIPKAKPPEQKPPKP